MTRFSSTQQSLQPLPSEDRPLGIVRPLWPHQGLGQRAPSLQFLKPLGTRSLSVLNPGIFAADWPNPMANIHAEFEHSPFFPSDIPSDIGSGSVSESVQRQSLATSSTLQAQATTPSDSVLLPEVPLRRIPPVQPQSIDLNSHPTQTEWSADAVDLSRPISRILTPPTNPTNPINPINPPANSSAQVQRQELAADASEAPTNLEREVIPGVGIGRQELGGGSQELGGRRQEAGVGSQELGGGRQELGGGRREVRGNSGLNSGADASITNTSQLKLSTQEILPNSTPPESKPTAELSSPHLIQRIELDADVSDVISKSMASESEPTIELGSPPHPVQRAGLDSHASMPASETMTELGSPETRTSTEATLAEASTPADLTISGSALVTPAESIPSEREQLQPVSKQPLSADVKSSIETPSVSAGVSGTSASLESEQIQAQTQPVNQSSHDAQRSTGQVVSRASTAPQTASIANRSAQSQPNPRTHQETDSIDQTDTVQRAELVDTLEFGSTNSMQTQSHPSSARSPSETTDASLSGGLNPPSAVSLSKQDGPPPEHPTEIALSPLDEMSRADAATVAQLKSTNDSIQAQANTIASPQSTSLQAADQAIQTKVDTKPLSRLDTKSAASPQISGSPLQTQAISPPESHSDSGRDRNHQPELTTSRRASSDTQSESSSSVGRVPQTEPETAEISPLPRVIQNLTTLAPLSLPSLIPALSEAAPSPSIADVPIQRKEVAQEKRDRPSAPVLTSAPDEWSSIADLFAQVAPSPAADAQPAIAPAPDNQPSLSPASTAPVSTASPSTAAATSAAATSATATALPTNSLPPLNPFAAPQPTIQRQPLTHSSPLQSSGSTLQTDREATDSDADQTFAAETPEEQTLSQPDGQASAEQNVSAEQVEQLSRVIYQMLRQRLLIEQERLGSHHSGRLRW